VSVSVYRSVCHSVCGSVYSKLDEYEF
jgi:hypothetical protein